MVIMFILIIVILIEGAFIMAAIDNLNQSVVDLKAAIDAINIPSNNDVAIQAAADSINASIVALKAKTA